VLDQKVLSEDEFWSSSAMLKLAGVAGARGKLVLQLGVQGWLRVEMPQNVMRAKTSRHNAPG
jgi:hypothetical protein